MDAVSADTHLLFSLYSYGSVYVVWTVLSRRNEEKIEKMEEEMALEFKNTCCNDLSKRGRNEHKRSDWESSQEQ